MIQPVYDGIVATAGGTQAAGVNLKEGINRVVTVATAADSVTLPSSSGIVGMEIVVINAAAANALTLYPAVGEAINALSANTGLSVAANKSVMLHCTGAGRWHSILTA